LITKKVVLSYIDRLREQTENVGKEALERVTDWTPVRTQIR